MTNPSDGTEPVLEFTAGYGYEERRHLSTSFRIGEGWSASARRRRSASCSPMCRATMCESTPDSGRRATQHHRVAVLFEGAVRAVVELASFSPFSVTHQAFLEQLPESIGLTINTIEANTLTENLLRQSQSQAEELRSQQEELRESNEDLERQASLLAERSLEAEQKNEESNAPRSSWRKKRPSSPSRRNTVGVHREHVARLRTPLNSLLILANSSPKTPTGI